MDKYASIDAVAESELSSLQTLGLRPGLGQQGLQKPAPSVRCHVGLLIISKNLNVDRILPLLIDLTVGIFKHRDILV